MGDKEQQLLALVERYEAAMGTDRELDTAIWLAAIADDMSKKAYAEGLGERLAEAEDNEPGSLPGLFYRRLTYAHGIARQALSSSPALNTSRGEG